MSVLVDKVRVIFDEAESSVLAALLNLVVAGPPLALPDGAVGASSLVCCRVHLYKLFESTLPVLFFHLDQFLLFLRNDW